MSEAKEVESKFGEAKAGDAGAPPDECVLPGMGDDPSVIARAATWFAKNGKLRLLANFAKDHWRVFEDEVDAPEDDGTGHKFEYEQCHQDFLRAFEEQLESFVEEEDFTLEDFDKEARDVRNGKSLTLFENEDAAHRAFLDLLLSTLDYAHFHQAMVKAARQQTRRK